MTREIDAITIDFIIKHTNSGCTMKEKKTLVLTFLLGDPQWYAQLIPKGAD